MGDQSMLEVGKDYLEDTEKSVQLNSVSSLEELLVSLVTSPKNVEWDLVGIAKRVSTNELSIIKANKSKIIERLTMPLAGSALGDAIVSNRQILENNLGRYSEFFDIREFYQQGYASLFVVPILVRGEKSSVFIASKREGVFNSVKGNEAKFFGSSFGSLVNNVMALQELADVKNILSAFFSSPHEIVFLIDASNGRVVNASKRASELLGMSLEDLLGGEIYRIFNDREQGKLFLRKVLNGESGKVVQEYRNSRGENGTFEIMPSVIKLRDSTLIKLACTEATQRLLHEEIYSDVIETMPVVLITLDSDGRIISLNNEIKVLGYEKEELIDGPISRIVCEGDYKALGEMLQKIREGMDKLHEVELRFKTKNGELKFFELNGKAHYDSLGKLIKSNWLVRDINERRKSLDQEQKLANVLTNSSDCIYSFDRFGFIRFWNSSAEKIFGFGKNEIIGKDVRILFPEERKGELDLVVKVLSENDRMAPFDTVRVKKNGERIYATVTSMAIQDDNGNVIEYMDIVKDLSDRKAKVEAERMKRKLEERNKHLSELNQMRSEFVSHVSHELKTPLTSIHGYASLLKDGEVGKLTDQQKEYMQIVVDETTRLTKLINDVLDITKIESGKFKLAMDYFDLKELVERCSCTSLAESKGLYVNWNIASDVPKIYGDKNKIAQVFINLISNAIKFTDRGGITVNVVRKSKSYVQVEVIDTGRGIPPEDLKNVFKKFYQSSVIQMKEGTGLGLSISKEIVKLHYGKMHQPESEVGKGSKFTFTLRTGEKKEREKKEAGEKESEDKSSD